MAEYIIGFIAAGMIVAFIGYFAVNTLIVDYKWNKFLKAKSQNKDIQVINSMLKQLSPYKKQNHEVKKEIDEILRKQQYYPIGTFDKQLEELRETIRKSATYIEQYYHYIDKKSNVEKEIAKKILGEKNLHYWGFE